MLPLLCIFACSLLLSLALTPLARALAVRWGLVDHPDGRRKIQARPIPVAGGLAVLLAAAAAVGIAALLPLGEPLRGQPFPLLGLLAGALVIAAVGVVDDYRLLRGRHKLLGQSAAVAVVISCGVMVRSISLFGYGIDLGWFAVPFTAFLLLGAINSLNLLDGMDGMLSSVGVTVSLAMAVMAALAGHTAVAGVALALAGALLGFLRYNFPPASIYLGDSGSMVVGLVLGTLAILSSLKGPATVALSAPAVLLTLPIFDTAAAIVRRKLTGRSIYTTDRGHLHHCLLRSGLSVRHVLLLVFGCCLLTGAGVLASQAFNNEWIALSTGLSVILTLILTRLFGHAEALLIKERLLALAGALFRPRSGGEARQLEVRLQGSADWKEIWDRLIAGVEGLNICQLRLDVNAPALHEGYHARWDRAHDEGEALSLWRAEIPLTARGQPLGRLEVAGQPDQVPVWKKLAQLTDVVEAFSGVLDASALEPTVDAGRTGHRLAEAVLN
jgi:UDP-GlcNAc:undecaprenyl-phosphate GlcNAc-1-phosphate transferase